LKILEEEEKEKEGKGFIAEGRGDAEYAETGNENGRGDAPSIKYQIKWGSRPGC
jgi:hypothetical protein